MNYDLTSFEKGLEQLSITLSGEQKQQFLTYYEYLVEKNKVMNLTAITEAFRLWTGQDMPVEQIKAAFFSK